ncbi:MAG: hypothetical protein FWG20_00095 [Candidatus Cloacimonetes bacterium]|nr:hypothetical protein [Candidatus Cloacimonadota bacterium]
MIYIDMDGVLTDFRKMIKNAFGKDLPADKNVKEILTDSEFRQLQEDESIWQFEETDFAQDILDIIGDTPFTIVSCVYGMNIASRKAKWLYYNGIFVPTIFIPVGTRKNTIIRPKFTELLIDDNWHEIKAWEGEYYHITEPFSKENFKRFIEDYKNAQ